MRAKAKTPSQSIRAATGCACHQSPSGPSQHHVEVGGHMSNERYSLSGNLSAAGPWQVFSVTSRDVTRSFFKFQPYNDKLELNYKHHLE